MLRHPAAFILDGCYVVDSMAGDEGQLLRTLPRHWLESHTVTAMPASKTPHSVDFLRLVPAKRRMEPLAGAGSPFTLSTDESGSIQPNGP